MVWVRYIDGDNFKDEPLFCSPVELTTRGIDVFNKVQDYLNEQEIPMDTLIGSCTDGAPAMLGVQSGFQAKLKQVAPNVIATHCMIHREALAAKTLPVQMKQVLTQAVKIVNYIKASALNTRLFRSLCKDMDSAHQNLLYHTEVRWLSRGNVLLRLYELRNEVREFLTAQKKNEMANVLNDTVWMANLCYLTDIFERLNGLNKSLQGREPNIIDFHDKLHGFVGTLDLLVQKVRDQRFVLLPHLNQFLEENEDIDTIPSIEDHLTSLKSEVKRYFPELDPTQFDLFRNPFSTDIAVLDNDDFMQEELVKLKTDTYARQIHETSSIGTFWCKIRHDYPRLGSAAIKKIMPYASTYVCESSFSTMAVIKTKSRNRLDIAADMRVALSNVEPDIPKLASEMQAQPSH
ncbi:Uncharacterised protein r2_g2546 [Pycnogonum litorale]